MHTMSIHPLGGKLIRTLDTWPAWLDEWNKTNSAEGLMGLLSWGLHLPVKDPGEVIQFYLDLADKNFTRTVSTSDEETRLKSCLSHWTLSQKALRETLGERAWSELKQCYFSHPPDIDDVSQALHPTPFGGFSPVYTNENGYQLAERLLAFAGTRMSGNLRQGSERDSIAKSFFTRFAEWTLRKRVPQQRRTDDETHWESRITELCASSVQEALLILKSLEATALLERIEPYNPKQFMEILKEMALDHWGTGKDCHPSIEAAFQHGDPLARIYLLRKLRADTSAKLVASG